MVLIVNGVTRFTVEQSLEGNQIANIIDMRIDTTGSTMSRNDAINDQAGVILDEWVAQMRFLQCDDLTIDAVRWVDLDSPTGSTGSISSTDTNALPLPGLQTGSPLPGNTAALVRKNLESAGRGRRAGRMYLAGLAESYTAADNGNIIDPTVLPSMNNNLANFLSGINEGPQGIDEYDSAMCVVHVVTRDEDGQPLTGVSSDVGSLVLDDLLATQRRRLRR